ncbi:putative Thioredoxin domain-containing protein [Seiridium cardinale]
MYTSSPTIATVALGLLSALPSVQAGLYLKSSPVVQVDAKNYDRLVAKSNYTTAVEFYAPWCGHCQNLKPAYEKAAKNLDGLARVAAVNCDEDENKPLCGQFGVQGFPTIKIVRPGKKFGKPVVDDYNGPRSAKDIVSAVVDKINNHVKKVTDKDIDGFLSKDNDTAKAILFTEKGTTSALLKSIAIDFLDVIQVAQVRNKETKATEIFGIENYPSLVLLPGGDKPAVLYDGELRKEGMVKFLSQVSEPHPVTGPEKAKAKKEKKEKSTKKTEPKSEEPAASSEEAPEATPSSKTTTTSKAAPRGTVELAGVIDNAIELTKKCLNPKAGICVLAFVPKDHDEDAEKALLGLRQANVKEEHGPRPIFPAYEVHTDDANVASMLESFHLEKKTEIIALNGKRGWWRLYEGDYSYQSLVDWFDVIRLNEGGKRTLPDIKIFVAEDDAPPAAETVEVKVEEEVKVEAGEAEPESTSTSWQGAEPTPEATESPEHERDEL